MATTYKAPTFKEVAAYKEPTFKEVAPYQSQYGDAINKLTDAVVNRQQFTYDPATDASYQALAKQYGRLGDRARQNTLGDYAANTGGYASTAAVSAAQQAQNDYNIQLSNMIPSLMQAAYDRYQGEYNMNIGALNAIASRDDAMYGRWNDNRNYNRDVFESNRSFGYNKWNDNRNYNRDVFESNRTFGRNVFESDRTYNYNKSVDDRDYKYQKARDKVADSQWAKEYGLDVKKFNWSKQQGNSGSGGGSGRSGGGRSYSGKSSSTSAKKSTTPAAANLYAGKVAAQALQQKKTNTTYNNGLATNLHAVSAKKTASKATTTKKNTSGVASKLKAAAKSSAKKNTSKSKRALK